MNNNKINTSMSGIDIAIALSNNDENTTLEILNLLKNFEDRMFLALTLDHFHIYGNDIIKFYKHCCRENILEFESTLKLFNYGYFSEDKIHKNLNLNSPIPFIDDMVAVKYASANYSGSMEDMLKLSNCGNELKQAFEEKLEKVIVETKNKHTNSQPGDDKK